jgi:hypothetical protein
MSKEKRREAVATVEADELQSFVGEPQSFLVELSALTHKQGFVSRLLAGNFIKHEIFERLADLSGISEHKLFYLGVAYSVLTIFVASICRSTYRPLGRDRRGRGRTY